MATLIETVLDFWREGTGSKSVRPVKAAILGTSLSDRGQEARRKPITKPKAP